MIYIIHRAHLGLHFLLEAHLMALDLDFASTYRETPKPTGLNAEMTETEKEAV